MQACEIDLQVDGIVILGDTCITWSSEALIIFEDNVNVSNCTKSKALI